MTRAETFRKQEKLLQFDHFTNNDGCRLGMYIANYLEDNRIAAAFSVKRADGLTLFQAATSGAERLNELWAEKKSQTVRVFGKSSFRVYFEAAETGQTVQDHGLQDTCRFAPGGFPIRLKDGSLAGAVAISGVDIEEHNLLVTLLAQYLCISEVPLLADAVE